MVSDIITKANGKDKVVDFRDGLQLASADSYAELHQGGGEKGRFPSVIRMVICDYSKGTGDKSVTVSANFEPTLPYEWMQVCNRSVGSTLIGKASAEALSYSYMQDKVNVYKKGQDGFAPVSRVIIQRTPIRQDGSASRYPWTLKITNGEAKVNEKSTGSITFDSASLRNTKEAFINVSDRDMFRMMKSVTRFIDAWENGAAALIAEGRTKMANERSNGFIEI